MAPIYGNFMTPEKMHVWPIVAAPSDTNRHLILFGSFMHTASSIAVHIEASGKYPWV